MFRVLADFDGDGIPEWAAAYRLQDEVVAAVYKHNGYTWVMTDYWRGSGYDITAFYAAPSMNRTGNRHNLVIGWQAQEGPAYLSVYEWSSGKLAEAGRYHNPYERGTIGSSRPPRLVNRYPAVVRSAEGTSWGYIDSTGTFVIPPQYEYAFDFQDNGLAIVQVKGRNGVIDSSGRYVVQPVYEYITAFSEGLAVVMDQQGSRVINESGAILTPKAYSFINSYSDGRALFSMTDPQGQYVYGYLDTSGKEAIPAQYKEGGDFKNGKAVVKIKDNEYALIGRGGEKLASYPYAFVGQLGDGMLPFQKEHSGKYGYLNEQGAVVIEPQFTGALPFQEGRAVVNTAEDYGNRYGLIDKTGHFVIQPSYNDIWMLGEGRLALGKAIDPEQPFVGSRYAIADLAGNVLTDFIFYDVADYNKGYASVHDAKETYFIDHSGRKASGLPVVPGSGTLSFEGSLIKANVDLRLSYFDRSGRMVWQQNKVIPLAPPYRVVEHKYKPNKDYLVYYPQVEGIRNPAVEKQVNAKLAEMSQVKPVDGEAQLDSSYTGDFSVEFFRKELLVLELNAYDYPFGAAHGMPSRVYAVVNLVSGRFFELKDLFKPGADYVKELSAIIAGQIKNDPQYSYVWPDSYKGISADQPFYVKEDALYLYFAPYEIAPYAAGFPTFRIPFGEIMNIVNTEGDFWKSFH